MPLLVLATTNPGKARELRELLAHCAQLSGITLTTASELGIALPPVDENGCTFAENACLKAQAAAAATGQAALADDSGLCVDALGGAPGLHSARWAGPDATDADRIQALLARLDKVPNTKRTARFVCAAALALPCGLCLVETGACEGVITRAPHGEDGFGYDPIFLLPALQRTMAQLSSTEKNLLSHRTIALMHLCPHIANITQ